MKYAMKNLPETRENPAACYDGKRKKTRKSRKD
jgi:hypothetical protein